jgi:hypothetical protein
MWWVLALVILAYIGYYFFQVVAHTKLPKPTCKRHTWVEAIMINPTTKEVAPILFCEVCNMMPSDDIDNPTFLEIQK